MITPFILGIFGIFLTKYTVVGYLIAIIFLADGIGRSRDYFRLKAKLKVMDLHYLIRRNRHTHCQRQTILLAALGLKSRYVNRYYRKLGYRWYHLAPDWVIDNKKILLTRRFWVKFVGI